MDLNRLSTTACLNVANLYFLWETKEYLESKPKSLHTGYGILAGIEMCLVRNRAEKELCED